MGKRNLYTNTVTGEQALKLRMEYMVETSHLEYVVAHRWEYDPDEKFSSRSSVLAEVKSWINEHGFTGDSSFDKENISLYGEDAVQALLLKARGHVQKLFPELYRNAREPGRNE